MRAAGFEPEDYADECTEVWPENWPAFDLFLTLSTQWRTGMNGPTGMDYAVLYPLLDRRTRSAAEYDELFADIRCMERAALDTINKSPTK